MTDNNEHTKQIKSKAWKKINQYFTPVPDSMELELAYWESFRSEWPMEQYKAGVPLCDIARNHRRSPESLEMFFNNKYGKDTWRRKRVPSLYKIKRNNTVRDVQIVVLLAEGWRPKEIAKSLNVNVDTVRKRIRTRNLREVAANANRAAA